MIKVCNLVRLLEKNDKGLFKKDGQKKVIREGVKVLEESVSQSEGNYEDSGMLYIVDEKANAEWHKSKEKPVKAKKTVETKTEEDAKN